MVEKDKFIKAGDCRAERLARGSRFIFKWSGEAKKIRIRFTQDGRIVGSADFQTNRDKVERTELLPMLDGLYTAEIYEIQENGISGSLLQKIFNVHIGEAYSVDVHKTPRQNGTMIKLRPREGERKEIEKLRLFYMVDGIKYRVPIDMWWNGFFVKGLGPQSIALDFEENSIFNQLVCRLTDK